MSDNNSGTEAVLSRLDELAQRQKFIVDVDGRKAVVLANADGQERIESVKQIIDEYQLAPDRVTGQTRMDDLASLLNECSRYKNDALSVYVHAVDPTRAPSIIAVFNDTVAGTPSFRDHRSTYVPQPSSEIRAWLAAGQRLISQEEFAELIEERLLDVKAPNPEERNMAPLLEAATLLKLQVGNPAELLEVSRGLQVNVSSNVKGKPNLHNGAVSFAFEESAQPTVTVPGAFLLDVPFFEGATKVLILARLRYKVEESKIKWRVLLHDVPRVYREAVDDLCRDIREAGHRVVLGQP
jgi:uncharacterized protein YfdQ (DUF2303 family)